MKALSDVASWATVSTVTISDPFGPGLFELPLQTLANRDYYLSAQVVSLASAVGVGGDASSAVQSVETVLSSEVAARSSEVASITLAVDTVDSSLTSRISTEESSASAATSSVVAAYESADTSLDSRTSEAESNILAVESGYNSGDTSVLAVASGYTSTAEATLESGYTSADTSLTSRLSSEESTRTSEIASVAALAGGSGSIYDTVITRTGTLTDANWTAIGAVYTMDASKVTSFTVEAVARDAGTIDGAYARYKCACICDATDAHFIGEAAATTTSVMSLISGDDGDDGGAALGFGVRAVVSGLTIQFQAQSSLYPGDITVRLRIGIIEDS